MQKVLGALLVIILLVACKKERPEGIIAPKQMTNLLYDLHLAEAYKNSVPRDTARADPALYYRSVFQRYGIDSAGFQQNLAYYAAQPALLQDMYAEISKRYRALEDIFMKRRDEQVRERARADSLKRVHYKDSIQRLTMDSIRYAQKKYLLYWVHPDSIHLRPPAWDVDSTVHYWIRKFYVDSAQRFIHAKSIDPETPATVPDSSGVQSPGTLVKENPQ